MVDIYSTQYLVRVVEYMDEPASFLLDTFFGQTQTSDTEEIYFDVDKSKPRLTPMVHPLAPGRLVEQTGYETKSFKPAYAKDLRVLPPNAPLKRLKGEPLGGSLTPMERRKRQIAWQLYDQFVMLTRREEVMAAEAMDMGRTTVTYVLPDDTTKQVVVDFGRDAALEVTKGVGQKWGDAGVDPLQTLEDGAAETQNKSGVPATTAIMDNKAWGLFWASERIQSMLDIRRGTGTTLNIDPAAPGNGRQKARYRGMIGDFDIWTYQDRYLDDDGVEQQLVPDYTLWMGAEGVGGGVGGVEGARAYGVIQDEEAEFTATRYFVKSWLERNPSSRQLLLQSAPLMVPYRVNATYRARVK